MKKKRLALQSLKVNSFITNLDEGTIGTLKGGTGQGSDNPLCQTQGDYCILGSIEGATCVNCDKLSKICETRNEICNIGSVVGTTTSGNTNTGVPIN